MKNIIFKGFHFSTFIPTIRIINSTFNYRKNIKFDESCKYSINESACVNKLCGFCFGFGVHANSHRFGWTYNVATQKIDIFAYNYDNNKLKKKIIHSVNFNEYHEYNLKYKYQSNYAMYDFLIDGVSIYKYSVQTKNKHLICTLGFYFGGNTRAPHKMYINVK